MSLQRLPNATGCHHHLQRADGSRVLIFDRRYKVSFIDESQKIARAHAQVARLPEGQHEREETIAHVMSLATGRVKQNPETLYLSADGENLRIFRRFSTAIAPHEFDALLSSLVNNLAFWRRVTSRDIASQATVAVAPVPSFSRMILR